MRTMHTFIISSSSELRVRFLANKTGLSHPYPLTHSSFPTDHSKAVLLLQFYFVCASVISYRAFVLSLFVPHPHLSFLVTFWWHFLDILTYFCANRKAQDQPAHSTNDGVCNQ